MTHTLVSILTHDYTFYIAMLVIGGIAIALLIERVWFLFFDLRDDSSEIMPMLEKHLRDRNTEKLLDDLKGRSGLLSRVFLETVPSLSEGEAAFRQLVRASLYRWVARFSKRLGYFSPIANVAMLMGLLGTIFGLIRSFQAIAVADPSSRQELLSNGISLAMNTTALGLILAIPVLLAGVFVGQKVKARLAEAEAAIERAIYVAFYQGR